ncbi:MAG: polysaccharide biosynthesis tyrosine autokinase [Enhydrobacter sp.]|nr:MAG: polysaccharide biosynthesis tyrosine autokinase [Enhydrobacter sp.]
MAPDTTLPPSSPSRASMAAGADPSAREPRGPVLAGTRTDVREMLRMLNRRKWHLTGVTALVCALAALVLLQITPQYRATALVMLDTRKAKVTNTADVLSGLSVDVAAVQTEIEVLRSATLLGHVVDKLRLDLDREYGAAPPGTLSLVTGQVRALYDGLVGAPASPNRVQSEDNTPRARAIAALTRKVQIATRGRSYVISVSLDSAEAAKARRIVDAIADFYLVDQLQAKLDANRRATEFFNERLDELRRNVEASERAIANFRERHGLTIGKEATVTSQSLSELNSQLIQARAQRADRESRLIALEQAARDPRTLGGVTEVLANPLVGSLRAQEAEVARRIGDLNQRYGDSHPRLLQARAEQGQIQARIGAEVAKIISSVRGDAEAARAKVKELEEQVAQLERQAGGLGQHEVELRQLEREAQSTRSVYEDFLKRSKELREQQDIQQPDARILSAAVVPPGIVYPRYALTMALALAVGLVLGVALIALMERLDGGFRTGEQIERLTGRPLIGMIPALSRLTLGKLLPAAFAIDKPSSAYAESLRSAYTAITLGTLDSPPRVIMVTSSLPGEGKSTFVCSLAGLMARSNPGKKIVVVDGDLRRSSVLKALAVPATGGTIDEYLSGAKPLQEVVGQETASGLYYIPARPDTPNSAEILDSHAMQQFVRSLAESFDLVFIDTPPLMAVSDARLTAKIADYVIFLVQWEQTARELAVNSLKLLGDAHRQVGVVLSQVNVRRHSRYGYGDYGYYYSKYRDYYTR